MDDQQPTYIAAPVAVTFAVPPTPRARLIEGPAGSGKTTRLAKAVADLCVAGTPASTILVLCASPDAARRFSNLLAGACPAAADVRVTVPRAVALQVLSSPKAVAHTGRDARMLAPFEVDFVLEDLKTTGVKLRRLREMARFFMRTLSELGDDPCDEWLYTGEEKNVFYQLKSCLAMSRGMLEHEVSNLAARYLDADAEALASAAYKHVFVDDYQMLSRASQVFANVVAAESVTVALDRAACHGGFEAYPYAGGADEFLAANPNAAVEVLEASHRPAAATSAATSLRETQVFSCDGEALRAVPANNPNEELTNVVDLVRSRVEQGADPARIYVVSPCAAWERGLRRAFEQTGVPVAGRPEPGALKGDIRELERCKPAQFVTALELVANPHDAVAWRCWVGYGDYLTRSNVLAHLREFATVRMLALDSALDAAATLAQNGVVDAGFEPLVERYQSGVSLIDAARGLRGKELLACLATRLFGEGAVVPPALAPFLSADGDVDDADAATLARSVQERIAFPAYEEQGVKIGPMEGLAGLDVQTIVFSGFVNGLFPKRAHLDAAELSHEKRALELSRDAHVLAFALERAQNEVAFSYFTNIELAACELLGVKVDRVRIKDGVRMVRCSPSVFMQI